MRAMRSPTSPVSDWYARLCLSFKIQVVYSVCRMRLSATGFTLPWQLVAAHDPGPIYFCGSLPTFAVCADVLKANARNAAQTVSAGRPEDGVKKCMVEVRKESLRLYRSMAQEVNA